MLCPAKSRASFLTNVVVNVKMVIEFQSRVDELPDTHVRGPRARLAGLVNELVRSAEVVVLFVLLAR